jgi:hypothetical protein
MPYYKVTVRQDAYIYHEGFVEADSAAVAASAARQAWWGRATLDIPLVETGHDGFDHVDCEPEDCELVTEEEFQVAKSYGECK